MTNRRESSPPKRSKSDSDIVGAEERRRLELAGISDTDSIFEINSDCESETDFTWHELWGRAAVRL